MRFGKVLRKTVLVLLAVVLMMQIPALALSSSEAFSDVPSDAWYKASLDKLITYTPGIINGKPDADGDGKPEFDPAGVLTRGEFVKMLAIAGDERFMQLSGNTQPYDPTPKNGEHWAAPYFRILDKYKVFEGLDMTASWASMGTDITRYEMAVMIINFLVNVQWENTVKTVKPENVITDYSSIPSGYRNAVVQVFGKGIINGFEDGSFGGDQELTRSQSVAVIQRILWVGERKLASFVDTTVQTAAAKPSGYVPAATQWLKNGWIDSYGSVKNTQLYAVLMGSASKKYFTSSSDAANYMKTVTVPVWKLNSSGGKYSTKISITVNKAVADDVVGIFTEIYNSPEKFPIESAGGARYTDTMRHSWGCAIDINAYQNAECRAYYNSDGSINKVVQTCGYGWWPLGTSKTLFAGSLSSPSAYSIPAGGSVVKAFKDYGWGWAGHGYSVHNGNQKFDYMHFSVLPNGG